MSQSDDGFTGLLHLLDQSIEVPRTPASNDTHRAGHFADSLQHCVAAIRPSTGQADARKNIHNINFGSEQNQESVLAENCIASPTRSHSLICSSMLLPSMMQVSTVFMRLHLREMITRLCNTL